MKQGQAHVACVARSGQPNSAPPTYAGNVRGVWLAHIQSLENKLKNAERELTVAKANDALAARALAETIRNEIAALKFLVAGRIDRGPER